MANNNLSLESLKAHLFEAIEGVKNLNDPGADQCEKTTIEQAKAISLLSGKSIDIYKTQVNALEVVVGMDNVKAAGEIMQGLGLMDKQDIKEITQ